MCKNILNVSACWYFRVILQQSLLHYFISPSVAKYKAQTKGFMCSVYGGLVLFLAVYVCVCVLFLVMVTKYDCVMS